MKRIKLKNKTLEIKNCGDCPFCDYDPYYDMSKNSGFDCYFLGRLIDDDKLKDHIEIPDDCPLEDLKQ